MFTKSKGAEFRKAIQNAMMNAQIPMLTAEEEGESMRIRGEIISMDQYEEVANRVIEEVELQEETQRVMNILMKDRWSKTGDDVFTREHELERVALFTPYNTSLPTSVVEMLSNERVTYVQPTDGSDSYVLRDNWRIRHDSHRVLPKSWTGKTVFFIDNKRRS